MPSVVPWRALWNSSTTYVERPDDGNAPLSLRRLPGYVSRSVHMLVRDFGWLTEDTCAQRWKEGRRRRRRRRRGREIAAEDSENHGHPELVTWWVTVAMAPGCACGFAKRVHSTGNCSSWRPQPARTTPAKRILSATADHRPSPPSFRTTSN